MIYKLAEIPEKLRSIEQAPKSIFYAGDLALLNRPLAAIVGTRRPSSYTKTWTKLIASELSKAGAVVVSGGAYGVDQIAHEAAFPNTIAILAGSIDTDDRKLIKEIRENALVLSEFEKEIEPRNWSFVHRNRLITGLADIVCVMEGEINSGTSASINRALAQNRSIWTIPHRLGESKATNMVLSQNRANIIWSEETLVRAMNLSKNMKNSDEILSFAALRPTYEEAIEKFGAKIYEYELAGKISVIDGRIEAEYGDTID